MDFVVLIGERKMFVFAIYQVDHFSLKVDEYQDTVLQISSMRIGSNFWFW